MVFIIVAGAGEGKSGAAYWLSEQLKKLGAEKVTIHDNDTTSENYAQIIDNYDRIVTHCVVQKPIQIVTKQRNRDKSDNIIVENLLRNVNNLLHTDKSLCKQCPYPDQCKQTEHPGSEHCFAVLQQRNVLCKLSDIIE